MKKFLLGWAALVVAFASAQEHKAALLLTIEWTPNGAVYRLNSKDVTQPLDALSKAIRSRGVGWPIIVAVDDRLAINTLDNARGLIDKAGFANSEYYVFNADSQKMAKISVGKAVPFPSSSR